ncbi:hypothetical protein HOE04_02105 [archaeon]|jgi:hypothetical protein|nr:hypothetical protein [archaeon]
MVKKIKVWSPETRQIVNAELIEPCDSPHFGNFWDFLVPLYVEEKINSNTYKLLMKRFKISSKRAKEAVERFMNI